MTNQLSRRQFLKAAGVAGAGALLAACVAAPAAEPAGAGTGATTQEPIELRVLIAKAHPLRRLMNF